MQSVMVGGLAVTERKWRWEEDGGGGEAYERVRKGRHIRKEQHHSIIWWMGREAAGAPGWAMTERATRWRNQTLPHGAFFHLTLIFPPSTSSPCFCTFTFVLITCWLRQWGCLNLHELLRSWHCKFTVDASVNQNSSSACPELLCVSPLWSTVSCFNILFVFWCATQAWNSCLSEVFKEV